MFGLFGREPPPFPIAAKDRASMRRDSGSPYGRDRPRSRISSRSSAGSSAISDTGGWTSSSDETTSYEHRGMAMSSYPNGASGIKAQSTPEKVTMVERLEVEDSPRVRGCNGVRLWIPSNSLRCGIGPITVEQTAEIVNDEYDHDYEFIVVQAVHCLPAPCTFNAPLTLDFAVADDHVRWWDRKAAREDALREYHVFSKRSEDDPWQEMDPEDVSLIWNARGDTCLRARINHFSWFSWGKRTTKASTNMITRHWGRSALVFNSTSSVMHITSLPTSFKTSKRERRSCLLTFCDVGVRFDIGKRTERMMLPVPAQSEIVPPGGITSLYCSGGAKETLVIVCFLPDRSKAGVHEAPTQETSPSSATSLPARSVYSTDFQTRVTGRFGEGTALPATRSSTWASDTAAAPSSGGRPEMEGRRSADSLQSGAAAPGPGAGQNGQPESEEMVLSMTKVLPAGKRLTILSEALNRRIYVEKNARALATYAMMLADFGNATE